MGEEPFTYTAWNGEQVTTNWLGALQMVWDAAYMRRWPNDKPIVAGILKKMGDYLMSKYDREKHLEVVLKQLIHKHFWGLELYWNYSDATTLRSKDPELWMQLMELIPEVINAK